MPVTRRVSRSMRRAAAATAVALASLSAAGALEVQKPVDFTPAGPGQFALTVGDGPLIIEKAWREIYFAGELVAKEEIRLPETVFREPITPKDPARGPLQKLPELKRQKPVKELKQRAGVLPPERKGVVVASVSVDAESFRKLKNGVYAQKLLVSARWAQEGNSPFTTKTWTHLAVREGRPTPITLEEYSRAVDPPVKDIGSDGRPIEVRTGLQGPALPPLKRVEGSDDAALKIDPKEMEWMKADQAVEKDER